MTLGLVAHMNEYNRRTVPAEGGKCDGLGDYGGSHNGDGRYER